MILIRPLGQMKISPTETPDSLRLKLLDRLGNFTWTLQYAVDGRVIPADEILLDDREYYASFVYDLPRQPQFHEIPISPSKHQRVEGR